MVAINQLVLGILITNLVNYSLRNEGVNMALDGWVWSYPFRIIPAWRYLAA